MVEGSLCKIVRRRCASTSRFGGGSYYKELFETGNSRRVPTNFAKRIARNARGARRGREPARPRDSEVRDSSTERGRAAPIQHVSERTVADHISI